MNKHTVKTSPLNAENMELTEKFKIIIAATYTAEPIEDAIEYLLEETQLNASLEFAPYSQVYQQLLDAHSLFYQNNTGLNILLVRPDDLLENEKSPSPQKTQELTTQFLEAVHSYQENCKSPLLIILSEHSDASIESEAKLFGRQVKENLLSLPGIYCMLPAQINNWYPLDAVLDKEADRFGFVPYNDAYFSCLALAIVRYCWSHTNLGKKVIVLDCDNTIWRGVSGEDGPLGVLIDGSFIDLQQFIRDQVEQGMLICLNSKNVEKDVIAVFETNNNMLLGMDSIAAWRINWNAKSENLKSLAAELDLSLDSFIFIDDNPVEIAEVQSNCPEVLSLQLPKIEAERSSWLKNLWCCDHYRTTASDKLRTRTYQDNIKRNQLQSQTNTFEDFLAQLELKVKIEPINPQSLARVAQLSQRTNQFNSCTRRLDEMAVSTFLIQAGHTGHIIDVTDRFGDYGLVGVIFTKQQENSLYITDFMLSCRVLGKGVEHQIFRHIGQMALSLKIENVVALFKASERNQPVKQFLEQTASKMESEHNEQIHFFYSSAALKELPFSTSISNSGQQTNTIISKPQTPSSNQASVRQAIETGIRLKNPIDIVTALRDKRNQRPSLQQVYQAAETDLEKKLAAIWQRVLKIQQVGRMDRFTDLGGSSLELVKVHGLIISTLGYDLPITVLFEYPTIQSLAAHLEGGQNNQQRMIAGRQRVNKQRSAIKAMQKRRQATKHG